VTHGRKIGLWFAWSLAVAAAGPGCSKRDFSPGASASAGGEGEGETDPDGGSTGKGGTDALGGTNVGGTTAGGSTVDSPGGAGSTEPGEAIFDVSAWDDGSYFAP